MLKCVQAEQVPLTYATVMVVATPVMRWSGRLTVVGQNLLPPSGPTLLMVNHDSARDPVIVGVAARRRQIRALAKASLWKFAPMGWGLDRMGQVPIERGRGHVAALSAAIDHLRRGQCIVFLEGTVSRGRQLRSLSGAGRLALAVPGTRVLGVRITGVVDIVHFPRRPRIRVEFFEPAGGQPTHDERQRADPPGDDRGAHASTTRATGTRQEAGTPPTPGRTRRRTRPGPVPTSQQVASPGRPLHNCDERRSTQNDAALQPNDAANPQRIRRSPRSEQSRRVIAPVASCHAGATCLGPVGAAHRTTRLRVARTGTFCWW